MHELIRLTQSYADTRINSYEFEKVLLDNIYNGILDRYGTELSAYHEKTIYLEGVADAAVINMMINEYGFTYSARKQERFYGFKFTDDGVVIIELYPIGQNIEADIRSYSLSMALAQNECEKVISFLSDKYMSNTTSVKIKIHYMYTTATKEITTLEIVEHIKDSFIPSAYPYIEGGPERFIRNYLSGNESVLLLHGIPGSGKTRFIRYLLQIAQQKSSAMINAAYVKDQRTLESADFHSILLRKISAGQTGNTQFFLILEDIDYGLFPREDGNVLLSSLLTTADGLIQSIKPKIIFTTNLASTRIDEALQRTGRTFASPEFRALSYNEASLFIDEYLQRKPELGSFIKNDLVADSEYTLAELFKRITTAKKELLLQD